MIDLDQCLHQPPPAPPPVSHSGSHVSDHHPPPYPPGPSLTYHHSHLTPPGSSGAAAPPLIYHHHPSVPFGQNHSQQATQSAPSYQHHHPYHDPGLAQPIATKTKVDPNRPVTHSSKLSTLPQPPAGMAPSKHHPHGAPLATKSTLLKISTESAPSATPEAPSPPGSMAESLKRKKKSHLSRDELARVCQLDEVTFEPYNNSTYMIAIRSKGDRKSLIGYRCDWNSCGYMNARVERMFGHIRSQHPEAPTVKKLVTTGQCTATSSTTTTTTASSASSTSTTSSSGATCLRSSSSLSTSSTSSVSMSPNSCSKKSSPHAAQSVPSISPPPVPTVTNSPLLNALNRPLVSKQSSSIESESTPVIPELETNLGLANGEHPSYSSESHHSPPVTEPTEGKSQLLDLLNSKEPASNSIPNYDHSESETRESSSAPLVDIKSEPNFVDRNNNHPPAPESSAEPSVSASVPSGEPTSNQTLTVKSELDEFFEEDDLDALLRTVSNEDDHKTEMKNSPFDDKLTATNQSNTEMKQDADFNFSDFNNFAFDGTDGSGPDFGCSAMDSSGGKSDHSLPTTVNSSNSNSDSLLFDNEASFDLDGTLNDCSNSSNSASGFPATTKKKKSNSTKNYIGKQNLFQEFQSEDVTKIRDSENRYIIALQKDMKIVGYRCDWPECEFLTCRKYVMVNHINGKHTNQRPYSCQMCNFTFVKRYFLKAHMYKVHKRRMSLDDKDDPELQALKREHGDELFDEQFSELGMLDQMAPKKSRPNVDQSGFYENARDSDTFYGTGNVNMYPNGGAKQSNQALSKQTQPQTYSANYNNYPADQMIMTSGAAADGYHQMGSEMNAQANGQAYFKQNSVSTPVTFPTPSPSSIASPLSYGPTPSTPGSKFVNGQQSHYDQASTFDNSYNANYQQRSQFTLNGSNTFQQQPPQSQMITLNTNATKGAVPQVELLTPPLSGNSQCCRSAPQLVGSNGDMFHDSTGSQFGSFSDSNQFQQMAPGGAVGQQFTDEFLSPPSSISSSGSNYSGSYGNNPVCPAVGSEPSNGSMQQVRVTINRSGSSASQGSTPTSMANSSSFYLHTPSPSPSSLSHSPAAPFPQNGTTGNSYSSSQSGSYQTNFSNTFATGNTADPYNTSYANPMQSTGQKYSSTIKVSPSYNASSGNFSQVPYTDVNGYCGFGSDYSQAQFYDDFSASAGYSQSGYSGYQKTQAPQANGNLYGQTARSASFSQPGTGWTW